MRLAGDWVDLMRLNVPHEQKLYTWWSYRAQDWEAVRPRPAARPCLVVAKPGAELAGYEILRPARGWQRPSDHVPVIARFDLD